ncbi:related to zinc finger protein odd-paired-like (opl) [Fusarium torulosum]|uniref:Related to zinc finger protein odd-paired-like (Opl) n=1 Tax=Fusarium torulosum TaxID=33205 RepID=A0AAE8SNX6_9HYPO|nr:related to zinc finger protein odd-paired-like (opl) [Fusarium torulosum]
MQSEMNLGPYMDDGVNLYSQAMSYPSTAANFSLAASVYDPRPSLPETSYIFFDSSSTEGAYCFDLTPSSSVADTFESISVDTESEHMSCPDSFLDTRIEQQPFGVVEGHNIGSPMGFHASTEPYVLANRFSMPRCSFKPVYEADSSTSLSAESTFELETAVNPFSLPFNHNSPIHSSSQRKDTELKRARIRSTKGRVKSDPSQVDVIRRAMRKCDYPSCDKAFRRSEHLKRHKQTFHGEGPNRFSCEFCGKDQFNRQDNLNNHRKLHSQPNSRNRGVEFIPAAVPVIEQERRCRKRRAPSNKKGI